MTAIICQHDIHFRFLHVINEYRLENSDIYQLCDRLKRDYSPKLMLVCGDQSGHNRSASNRGHRSMYDIMQMQLGLNWSQIKAGRGKPANYVQTKRNLANGLLTCHPIF